MKGEKKIEKEILLSKKKEGRERRIKQFVEVIKILINDSQYV